MSATFAERCAAFQYHFPATPALIALAELHADMLAEIARLTAQRDNAVRHCADVLAQSERIQTQSERLTAENAALRADAERYRWLRGSDWRHFDADWLEDNGCCGRGRTEAAYELALDTAIDAAMSA
jgi:hypothetical protein